MSAMIDLVEFKDVLIEVELVVLSTADTLLQLVDMAVDAWEAVGMAPVVVYCVEDIVSVEVDVTVVMYVEDVAEDVTVVEVKDEAVSFAEEASCVYVAVAQLNTEANAQRARMMDASMLNCSQLARSSYRFQPIA